MSEENGLTTKDIRTNCVVFSRIRVYYSITTIQFMLVFSVVMLFRDEDGGNMFF
jgi:hypothetical protein